MNAQEIVVKRTTSENESALYDVFANGRRVMQSIPYELFLKYLQNIHEVSGD